MSVAFASARPRGKGEVTQQTIQKVGWGPRTAARELRGAGGRRAGSRVAGGRGARTKPPGAQATAATPPGPRARLAADVRQFGRGRAWAMSRARGGPRGGVGGSKPGTTLGHAGHGGDPQLSRPGAAGRGAGWQNRLPKGWCPKDAARGMVSSDPTRDRLRAARAQW